MSIKIPDKHCNSHKTIVTIGSCFPHMIWSCIWQKDTVLSKMTTSIPQDDPTETGTETGGKKEFQQIILKWDEGGNASHYNVHIEDNYASLLQEVIDTKSAMKKVRFNTED